MIKRTRFFLIFARVYRSYFRVCSRENYQRHRQFRYRLASIKSTNCNKLMGVNGGRRWRRRSGFGNRDCTAEGIGSVVKLSKFARFAWTFYSVLSDLTLPTKKETSLLTAKLRANSHIVLVRVFVDEIRNSVAGWLALCAFPHAVYILLYIFTNPIRHKSYNKWCPLWIYVYSYASAAWGSLVSHCISNY